MRVLLAELNLETVVARPPAAVHVREAAGRVGIELEEVDRIARARSVVRLRRRRLHPGLRARAEVAAEHTAHVDLVGGNGVDKAGHRATLQVACEGGAAVTLRGGN